MAIVKVRTKKRDGKTVSGTARDARGYARDVASRVLGARRDDRHTRHNAVCAGPNTWGKKHW